MGNLYDVVIVGGGPAGLTAAIYLARARYRVVVVEKEHFGGQITITSEVVNYPGVERTSGTRLTEDMRKQAQNFGAEFLLAEVTKLDMDGDVKKVYTARGILECFGVLLATGASPRMVGFKGEEEFKGHGVAYCATCDGEFFTGKEVFVIGGGFAAAEECVFLTKYAKHVTILIREEDFTCAKSTADAARNHEKITVITNVQVKEAAGDSVLQVLRWENNTTGEITEYRPPEGETFGIFVFAGYEPATSLIQDIAKRNEQGYVETDRNQKTSVDGLYAAGDVCIKSLRQVVTAVGDGALAATELERYAAALQKKTGLKPERPQQEFASTKTAEPNGKKTETEGDHDTDLFSAEILSQLQAVFARMEGSLVLKLFLEEGPVSAELRAYMEEMANLTDKISVEVQKDHKETELPCVRVFKGDGKDTGLAFHGVPGGHEFTSFVLGLYNAAGPGQALDQDILDRIKSIDVPVNMQVMVSLSCTMCPELVTAAQLIASRNANVRAEVYDLNHFPELKDRYQVMSVPCMVINGGKPGFGKKNVGQLLDMIDAWKTSV